MNPCTAVGSAIKAVGQFGVNTVVGTVNGVVGVARATTYISLKTIGTTAHLAGTGISLMSASAGGFMLYDAYEYQQGMDLYKLVTTGGINPLSQYIIRILNIKEITNDPAQALLVQKLSGVALLGVVSPMAYITGKQVKLLTDDFAKSLYPPKPKS